MSSKGWYYEDAELNDGPGFTTVYLLLAVVVLEVMIIYFANLVMDCGEEWFVHRESLIFISFLLFS